MAKSPNHFGTTLKRLMEENNVSGADIFRLTEIPTSTISRWRSGEQTHVNLEWMPLLTDAVCRSQQEKAELIASLLKDIKDLCGQGSQLITVRIRGEDEVLHEQSADYGVKLPPSDEATLKRLAEKIPTMPQLSSMLKDLDLLTGEP